MNTAYIIITPQGYTSCEALKCFEDRSEAEQWLATGKRVGPDHKSEWYDACVIEEICVQPKKANRPKLKNCDEYITWLNKLIGNTISSFWISASGGNNPKTTITITADGARLKLTSEPDGRLGVHLDLSEAYDFKV